MHYYFAYGSNMDAAQMKERCPSAELVGVATLHDYRLAFTIFSPERQCGCADIVASPGDTVYGLLYRLTEADMQAMDAFEGHPVHYQRIPVRVRSGDAEIEAQSYEVVHKQDGLQPSTHYLGLMQAAAEKYSFPENYRAFLKSFMPPCQNSVH